VHVEFAEPFCPVLRRILIESATAEVRAQGEGEQLVKVHDRGCYVCMEGPAFSTRAESLMHRLWGGDLIGMTAMPEAKLAKEAEISYALIALVTDYDCWRQKPPAAGADKTPEKPDPFSLLQEIIGNLKAATENAMKLMRQAVEQIAKRREELAQCPAQHALRLAVYKARFEPVAAGILEQAGRGANAALQKIFSLYFVTDSGKQAGLRLIDLYLESGEFAAAARIGERLLQGHPTIEAQRPMVLF